MLVDQDFLDLPVVPADLESGLPVELDGEPIPEVLPERVKLLLQHNPKLREVWEATSYPSHSEQANALMFWSGFFGLSKMEAASLHVAHYARLGRKEDGIRKATYTLRAWTKGRELAEVRERSNGEPAGKEPPEPEETAAAVTGPEIWQVLDAADHADWKVEPLQWMVRPLMPKGTIGITGGLPKIRKSLITLDLLLHVIHGRPWLGRFEIGWNPRILYLAREDPTGRLQYRLAEMQKVYGFPPLPRDRFLLLVRERFHLTDPAHIEWLHRLVRERGIEVIVFDVLGRMAKGLDLMNPKDWGIIMDILETLNRDFGVTLNLLDHARKPPQGAGKIGGSSPIEVKGPIEKYGAADWMMILSETTMPARVEVYGETKDSDERPHFLVDVAPRDSGKPKLTWAGDVGRLAEDRREVGRENRETVLAVFQAHERLQGGEVERRLSAKGSDLSRTTIREHLKALTEEIPPRLVREGKNRDTRYRLPEPSGQPCGGSDAMADGEVQSELFSDS